MYEIAFYHQPLARCVQQSGNNLFECKKVDQIIHIVLPNEQSIKFSTFSFQAFRLNFKWSFAILSKLWKAEKTNKNSFKAISS